MAARVTGIHGRDWIKVVISDSPTGIAVDPDSADANVFWAPKMMPTTIHAAHTISATRARGATGTACSEASVWVYLTIRLRAIERGDCTPIELRVPSISSFHDYIRSANLCRPPAPSAGSR